ncbi:MAG: phosphoribosylanthranilate isomerase [Aestuariivirga sp.]
MPTEVKICGLSTPETLDAALDSGADYVGLVFFAKSPRNVSVETAAALASRARGRAKIVALVVDAADDLLASIRDKVKPDLVQAHGNETPERVTEISKLTGLPVMKVVKIAQASDFTLAADFEGHAAMMLFDAKAPKGALPGGNGLSFDWTLIRDANPKPPYMLAGGLTPENVGTAIKLTGAPAIDVSSGVESAPGRKDVVLIRKFIEAAKTAS